MMHEEILKKKVVVVPGLVLLLMSVTMKEPEQSENMSSLPALTALQIHTLPSTSWLFNLAAMALCFSCRALSLSLSVLSSPFIPVGWWERLLRWNTTSRNLPRISSRKKGRDIREDRAPYIKSYITTHLHPCAALRGCPYPIIPCVLYILCEPCACTCVSWVVSDHPCTSCLCVAIQPAWEHSTILQGSKHHHADTVHMWSI